MGWYLLGGLGGSGGGGGLLDVALLLPLGHHQGEGGLLLLLGALRVGLDGLGGGGGAKDATGDTAVSADLEGTWGGRGEPAVLLAECLGDVLRDDHTNVITGRRLQRATLLELDEELVTKKTALDFGWKWNGVACDGLEDATKEKNKRG